MRALLVLEDGTCVKGTGFGAEKTVFGELVFNTNMTGYQESLTDPSYKGQILMATYPLIGNYGTNKDNFESDKIQPEGYVVSEECDFPSHRKHGKTLHDFLKEYDVPGISEVDTRALTIKIRKHGTVKAALATYDDGIDADALIKKVREMPHPTTRNLVDEVSCKKKNSHKGRGKLNVVCVDCGVKRNIIRNLSKYCNVLQVPYNITSDEINKLKPDGILVSNGPGDPAHPEIKNTTVKMLNEIASDFPIMGICLGHQVLSIVFGAETFKLKFGHRGGNQPVKDMDSGKVYITSQNHGFAVKPDEKDELIFTHYNVNDKTVEGMKHTSLPVFSVQYHPEASPGPKDSIQMFDFFMSMIKREGRGGSITKA
ncbi:MAG: glutamine-hydrolyzing carbamoyl-phosphate synthase small subunit [Thermoplasmata archaeon]|nr:MAG: glutamine-hydrolyzing carbamoyl-phosphate synthase small subunit [Thermoplasmata archaeon]